jgi:hypothetical protein
MCVYVYAHILYGPCIHNIVSLTHNLFLTTTQNTHMEHTHIHIYIFSQCLESGWSIKSLAAIPAMAIRWCKISSSEGGNLGSNDCTDNRAISGGPRLRFIPPSCCCCQSWEASELLEIDIAGDIDCSLGGSFARGLSVYVCMCVCMSCLKLTLRGTSTARWVARLPEVCLHMYVCMYTYTYWEESEWCWHFRVCELFGGWADWDKFAGLCARYVCIYL